MILIDKNLILFGKTSESWRRKAECLSNLIIVWLTGCKFWICGQFFYYPRIKRWRWEWLNWVW